jgi:hypothetical protein
VLTDHNFITEVDGLNALQGAPGKFLVVRGEEVTSSVGDFSTSVVLDTIAAGTDSLRVAAKQMGTSKYRIQFIARWSCAARSGRGRRQLRVHRRRRLRARQGVRVERRGRLDPAGGRRCRAPR